jgi:diguanylate cyclase (GGDEF)-like protein
VKPVVADLDQLLRDLGLSGAEIAERKSFLDLGDDDVRLLVDLHALLERHGVRESFIDKFYSHLLAFPGTRVFLRDTATVERLKHVQSAYFDSLTAGDYGPDYVRHRVRVGLAHERIGLDPKWYLGAYNKYLNLLIAQLGELLPGEPARVQGMVQALLKIVLFDMGLAMDTYIHAGEQALQNRNAQLETLNELSITLTTAQDLTVILDQIMVQGVSLIGARAACIAFYDYGTRRFHDWVTTGLSPRFVRNINFAPGGLADEAFTSGVHILSNDRPETRHQLSRLARDEGILGFICLPLTSHGGRLGVIYFYRGDRDNFEPAEISLLTTFAHLAAAAIENVRLRERLESEARTDALTGLFNRRVFDQRLEEEQRRAKRYGKPYALVIFDIDHFKRVNDEYGHPAGDAVLAELARRATLQVRDVDTLARYGGEEFAVIFPEISGGAAKEIGERIRHAIADKPFALPDGQRINVTVSVGISCFPNCAVDAAQAINTADQALYMAKQEGRNRVLLYRETLKARLEKNPELVVELLNQGPEMILPVAAAVSVLAPFMRHHAEQVRQATVLLAQVLKLSPDDVETLRLAALLHDIGMFAVPAAVLGKRTPLAPDEERSLNAHPALAAGWLARVPALARLAPIVRHHHEHFDGQGYPDGLRGEKIPWLARVLSLADAYASMLTDWPGRCAMSGEEARAELRRCAGSQFDPELVQKFLLAPGKEPA